MATVKMAPNVPLPMRIRYVNVWPNDPSKDPKGKGYGSSVHLKGNVGDDAEGSVYPKGFTDRTLAILVEAGVIARGEYEYDPIKMYSLPVLNGDVTLTLLQAGDERYPTFAVALKSNGKPVEASKRKEGVTQGSLPGDEAETGAPPAQTATDPKAELFAAHSQCFKHICDKYVPYAAEKGVELSLEGVSALTAQLWIELNKKGLV